LKKIIVAVIFTALYCTCLKAELFTVTGSVYNYDGAAGSSSTPNSFAFFFGYRIGVAGQIAEHTNGEQAPNCVSPNKIFASNGSIPAFYSTEVGSSAWNLAPGPLAAGQIARVILEVSPTGNCYTGSESYVACASKIILASEIVATGMTLPDCELKLLPAPVVTQMGINYINISWTGIDLDNIGGYNIYRDEDGSGNYVLLSNVTQNRGNIITYSDSDASLSQGKTYTYKISARFVWGGGNGAPDYYETAVKSKKSMAAQLLPPTPTITPTYTVSIYSPTVTETITLTDTQTGTPTLTLTATQTNTQTFTQTYTYTGTYTATFTDTLTLTDTVTMTFTVTPTSTITQTVTQTSTPAATLTPTIVPALLRERLIVFNNPVRDSRVKLAFMADASGQAELDFYSINAERVKRYRINVSAGANDFDADFKGVAPGVYIIRVNVNGRNLPDRKVAVIK
jgi:hypothetical protein